MASIDVVKLLQRLVAIDSTSARPNGPVLDVLEEELRRFGFTARRMTWRDANGAEKQNLIARRGPEREGGLALVGHSDCVPFDPAWEGALAGEIQGNTLLGRGAADTKSFLAAAVGAASQTPELPVPLYIVATADEEVGCLGAKRLLAEGVLRPVKAIIGEPTRLIPVRAHKGYCLAEIEITGIEAHSAYPDLGASAIFAGGRLLRELERIQETIAAEQDPLFAPPYTTLNVGLMQGGKAKNVIPGACVLTLEWRPIPGQDVRRVLALVEQACAQLADGRINATVRASRLDVGVSVPEHAELIGFLEGESGNRAETIPFGTELPQLTAMGAQACVFGPGDIRVAHRTGEFVPLDELRKAEAVLAQAITRFCAGAAVGS
jgi:acetylornithine deacetylase